MRMGVFKTTVIGVFVMTIIGLLSLSTGCSASFTQVEDVVSKTFTVGEGGTLTMNVGLGSIEIITENGNDINVKIIRKVNTSKHEKARGIFDQYKVDFNQSGKDLTIKNDYRSERGFFSWLDGKQLNIKYIITVPKKYNLDLNTKGGSVTISEIEGKVLTKTSGGSLKFNYINGSIYGRTSGGSIRVDKCTGNVDVDTSGGSIRIGRVEGDIKADTSGGSITIEDASGTVKCDTSGGSINTTLSKQPKSNCKLTTSGGSITVFLAPDSKVDVNARTSAGRISTDFTDIQGNIEKSRMNAKINGGGPELFLETSGGSIRIKKI